MHMSGLIIVPCRKDGGGDPWGKDISILSILSISSVFVTFFNIIVIFICHYIIKCYTYKCLCDLSFLHISKNHKNKLLRNRDKTILKNLFISTQLHGHLPPTIVEGVKVDVDCPRTGQASFLL